MAIETALIQLGFTKKEIRVLLALLRLKRAKITTISTVAKLPRTSIYGAIQMLKKRELITSVRVGNHQEWEILPPHKLTAQIQEGLGSVRKSLPELERMYGTIAGMAPEAAIKVYETHSGLSHAYNEILKLKHGERVYSIEGSASVVAKFAGTPQPFALEWQEQFKKRGLILDAIASEDVLKTLDALPQSMKEMFLGRMVAATIFPKETLDFSGDLLVFHHSTLITLPKRNIAIFIENAEIAEMFKSLHGIIREFGETFDLNQWFRESLSK